MNTESAEMAARRFISNKPLTSEDKLNFTHSFVCEHDGSLLPHYGWEELLDEHYGYFFSMTKTSLPRLDDNAFDFLARDLLLAVALGSDIGQEQVSAALIAACETQDDALALSRELAAMGARVAEKARNG